MVLAGAHTVENVTCLHRRGNEKLGRAKVLSCLNHLPRTGLRGLHPEADDIRSESTAAQEGMEPPVSPLTFVGAVRVGQALDQSGALTVEPAPSSRTSQVSLRGFFVVEGLVDGLFRYLGGHSPLAQLLGQTEAPARPEADPAAHKGRREGMVIDEPLFLEET